VNREIRHFLIVLRHSARDLLPIVVVIAFFQLAILQQPFPQTVDLIVGMLLVVLGLTLFIRGLEMGLFPIGESLAYDCARKGSLFWLLAFAFALGCGTTVAEPALIAVAGEAAKVAAEGGMILDTEQARSSYALGLRYTVAISVGLALVVGVMRILRGWPIQYLIVGIAYDSGGVTTSTITVPLVTALGIGLASSIKGRNPMVDGFGLIAFASLTPMMFVMIYGMLIR
jgi:hypothetical protein